MYKRLWIYGSHIFELRLKTWIWKRSITSFYYFLSSVHYCEDRFHIHVFNRSSNIWLPYINNRLFTTSRVYLEPTQWPTSSRLVSSVGRALHRYRRGHGFKSRTGLIFFRPSFHYFLRSVHYCEDRFHIHDNGCVGKSWYLKYLSRGVHLRNTPHIFLATPTLDADDHV